MTEAADRAVDSATALQAHPVAPERRAGDRRRRPTPILSRYSLLGGRRRGGRRGGEHENQFVDLYSTRLAVLVCVFFALTVLDSVSTVIYLRKGGQELNPIALWMLRFGEVEFVLIKGIVTAVCALFVLLHKNFRYAKGAIIVGFGFYFALAAYHLVLQWKAMHVPISLTPFSD